MMKMVSLLTDTVCHVSDSGSLRPLVNLYDGDAAADVLVLLNMIIISHIYGAIPTFSNE